MKSIKILSGNTIKIIAALTMLIDHIGLIFFPTVTILRIIGRISFPLFAVMIAEGCKHTKNKLKYFLLIFVLAVLCQIVYGVFIKDMYLSVLFTFSFAILMIYALQNFEKTIKTSSSTLKKILSGMVFILSIVLVAMLNCFFEIDYGFYGCVLPLFVALFNSKKEEFRTLTVEFSLLVGLILLSFKSGGIQWFSLLAIIPILFYSGKRGKINIKYFFYIFYPSHLAILYGISLII